MSFENTAFYAAVESMVRASAISAYESKTETEQLRSFLEAARCDAGSLPGLIYNGDVQAFFTAHHDAILDIIAEMDDDGCGLSAGDLIEALRGDAWRIAYPAVDHVMSCMFFDMVDA